LFNKVESQHY